MQTIHKYLLDKDLTIQTVPMPVGARIISSQMQSGRIFIWAIVGQPGPFEKRVFQVIYTGDWFRELTGGKERNYVATIVDDIVYHVFELIGVYTPSEAAEAQKVILNQP